MKRIFKKFIIFVSIMCFTIPALVCINDGRANEAYDELQAIEQDSMNAEREADKGNNEGAREDVDKGFDTLTSPHIILVNMIFQCQENLRLIMNKNIFASVF